MGDQVQKSSKVFARLSTLGLKDETAVLDVLIGKIVTNLKFWADKCVDLFVVLLCMRVFGFSGPPPFFVCFFFFWFLLSFSLSFSPFYSSLPASPTQRLGD